MLGPQGGRPDVRTSRRPNVRRYVRTSERPDGWAAERLDVRTAAWPDVQTTEQEKTKRPHPKNLRGRSPRKFFSVIMAGLRGGVWGGGAPTAKNE